MPEQLTSPYSLGARRGLTFGVMLCAMFFAMVYAERAALLGLLAIVIFLSVPFFIYKALRHTYVEERGMTTLSGLWMQGIMIFACGSIICAAVTTVYMRWIEPTFVVDLVRRAADFYAAAGDPSAEEVATVLNRMIESHTLPSALSIAMEMTWLSIFSGSMLSLLMALLARARAVPPQDNTRRI